MSDRITAYALYVDPPLGRAGMTEAEVRKSGPKALIGKRPVIQGAMHIHPTVTELIPTMLGELKPWSERTGISLAFRQHTLTG